MVWIWHHDKGTDDKHDNRIELCRKLMKNKWQKEAGKSKTFLKTYKCINLYHPGLNVRFNQHKIFEVPMS